MVYFDKIQPSNHYLEEHQEDVPWDEVITVLLSNKAPKKKGKKFEITNNKYYVLFFIKNKTLYIINAKKIRKK